MNILDTTAIQPLNFGRLRSVDTLPPVVYDTSKSLDIFSVADLWTYVSRQLVEVFASATRPGLLQSVVVQNNLTDFAIEYDGSLHAGEG